MIFDTFWTDRVCLIDCTMGLLAIDCLTQNLQSSHDQHYSKMLTNTEMTKICKDQLSLAYTSDYLNLAQDFDENPLLTLLAILHM